MLCNKCKTNPPFEDDSWCLSCSGWESIGQDLCAASGLGGRDKGRRGALEELSKPEEPKAEVKEREPLPRSRSRSSTS